MQLTRLQLSVVGLLGLGVTAALGASCRVHPVPFEYRTVQKWVWRNDEGRRCYYSCRSQYRFCASRCSGSQSVIWGPGGWAIAQHGPAHGCFRACYDAGQDCMRGCPSLEVETKTYRHCPDWAYGNCFDPNPAGPPGPDAGESGPAEPIAPTDGGPRPADAAADAKRAPDAELAEAARVAPIVDFRSPEKRDRHAGRATISSSF